MPVFYVFTFVHRTAFYSPATEALINNNNKIIIVPGGRVCGVTCVSFDKSEKLTYLTRNFAQRTLGMETLFGCFYRFKINYWVLIN